MSEVTLYHGDCLEIMKEIPDGSVDAVITDPPYGMNKFDNDHEQWHFLGLIEPLMKADSTIYMFCGDDCYIDARTNLTEHFGFGRTIVWSKTVWQGGGDYQLSHEYILYSRLGKPNLNLYTRKNTSNSMKMRGKEFSREKSVWFDDGFNSNCDERNGHPTQKPLAIISKMVDAQPQNATILDPFMGSGTTGVACVQTGRNFIGIEIDRNYYEIAEKRIAEAQMQLRLEI